LDGVGEGGEKGVGRKDCVEEFALSFHRDFCGLHGGVHRWNKHLRGPAPTAGCCRVSPQYYGARPPYSVVHYSDG
jgi:hypothetical protein